MLLRNNTTIIRVLKVQEDRSLVIDCVKRTMPKWIDTSSLSDYAECSEADLYERTAMILDRELTPEEQRIAQERYTMIAPVLPFIGNEKKRNQMINLLSESQSNGYLQGESQIDNRSTHEGEANRVPLVHEGPEARAALERGVVFDSVKENIERRQINAVLARIEKIIQDAKRLLEELRERLKKWRQLNEERRSTEAITIAGRVGADLGGIPIFNPRTDDRTRENRSIPQIIKNAAVLEQRIQKIHHRRHRR